MAIGKALGAVGLGFLCGGALAAFQNFHQPWREYPGMEYNDFPVPPDYREPAEFVFGRLMYPNASVNQRGFGRFGWGARDWRQGGRGTSWTTDYPRSDRHFAAALRRLSRVQVRSVEQAINLEEGDHYDWPWLYAVEAGHWELTSQQAGALREYLLRGGFLLVDDFHGDFEWAVFEASMKKILPDRPMVDLPKDEPIFHTVYDLDDKYQVPGAQVLRSGRPCERCQEGGAVAHWRGIYDDRQRLLVAICHNMDLGDSWEHADNPRYPQEYSALGIRLGVNYAVYAMSH